MSQFIVEGIHDCNSFISPHCTTDIFKKLKKNYNEKPRRCMRSTNLRITKPVFFPDAFTIFSITRPKNIKNGKLHERRSIVVIVRRRCNQMVN